MLYTFSRRELPRLAKKPPLNKDGSSQPRYIQVRSFAFHPSAYPGYEHRRTIGFVKGDNDDILRGNGGLGVCRTWEFVLREDQQE